MKYMNEVLGFFAYAAVLIPIILIAIGLLVYLGREIAIGIAILFFCFYLRTMGWMVFKDEFLTYPWYYKFPIILTSGPMVLLYIGGYLLFRKRLNRTGSPGGTKDNSTRLPILLRAIIMYRRTFVRKRQTP